MSGSGAAEARALDGGARGAAEPAESTPTEEGKATGPRRGDTFLLALLSGGLAGALLSGVVSVWLFYAKWPVEREQMLATTLKIAEETVQATLTQEATKAQTRLSETQDRLTQLHIEMKQIDRKYEDTLKQIQADTAKQEGKLVELQRRQAEIKTKSLPAREDSAVTRESVDAANAITSTIQSVVPIIQATTNVGLINKPGTRYHTPDTTNKILISSDVTNNGRYPFRLSISVEVSDANGADIPVSPWIEGQSTPSGLVQPNQTLKGSTTLVFPEEWVRSRPGIIQIETLYQCQTPTDIVDSLAKQVHVHGIREQLADKSSFTFSSLGTINFQ